MEENSNQPVNTTQETTAQVPVPPQPSVAPKSHKKRNIFISVVGAIILLTAGVGLGYVLFGGELFPQSTQKDSVTEQQNSNITPDDVVSRIKEKYASEYTLLDIDENNQPKSGELSVRLSKQSPIYKAEGYDFYTNYSNGSTIEFVPYNSNPTSDDLPLAESVAIRNVVAGIYLGFGLEKQDVAEGQRFDKSAGDVYLGNGLICTIEHPSEMISSNRASCGLISAYSEAAGSVKPFVDALPDATETTFLINVVISDSETPGFQKATATRGDAQSIGSAAALFYRKEGGEWMHFVDTQEIIACSEYDTEDLKSAFKGDECYVDADNFQKV